MVEAMRADTPVRVTVCRQAVRQDPPGIIRNGMAEDVDRWPGSPEGRDRRNGTQRRRPPCEFGDIGPAVLRTRRYRPAAVLGSCTRRAAGSTGSFPPAPCPAYPPAGSARSWCPCSKPHCSYARTSATITRCPEQSLSSSRGGGLASSPKPRSAHPDGLREELPASRTKPKPITAPKAGQIQAWGTPPLAQGFHMVMVQVA